MALPVEYSVIFKSHFHHNVLTDFESVGSFRKSDSNSSFTVMQRIRGVCSLTRKYELHVGPTYKQTVWLPSCRSVAFCTSAQVVGFLVNGYKHIKAICRRCYLAPLITNLRGNAKDVLPITPITVSICPSVCKTCGLRINGAIWAYGVYRSVE